MADEYDVFEILPEDGVDDILDVGGKPDGG
jgi:hypothetical protein